MSKIILSVAEARDGKLRKACLEATSAAAELSTKAGAEPVALLLGSGVGELAGQLGKAGARRVVVVDAPDFSTYSADGHARAIAGRIKAIGPEVVLFGHTSQGRDLAPRVAAHLRTGLVSDATSIACDGGNYVVTKPVYAGKAYVRCTPASGRLPLVVTLRPNAFPAATSGGAPAIEKATADVGRADFKAIVKEVVAASGGKVLLQEAKVIVAGGRGLKGPENWHLIESLVAAFGPGVAAQGASRAVVDAGWRPHAEQVGQTGKVVAPTLYIAVGVSGAIQHIAGMSTSKYIVAINKDPEAPIFKLSDYGIVGDAIEVLPAMTEAVKKVVSEH